MNNVVLITGASGTIGSALTLGFAKAGYRLALQYNSNESQAKALAHELDLLSVPYLFYKADIKDEQQVIAMHQAVLKRLGKVDILINNAGVALEQKLLSDCTVVEYYKVFDVNVLGTMLCVKHFSADMVSKQNGCIINISSIWGLIGGSCEAIYSASKAAVIGLSKALSQELAPSNIRVNCIAPGMILSKMNSHLTADEIESFVSSTPLGRVIKPEEVFDAALYLCNAKSITGQTICVDGGLSN